MSNVMETGLLKSHHESDSLSSSQQHCLPNADDMSRHTRKHALPVLVWIPSIVRNGVVYQSSIEDLRNYAMCLARILWRNPENTITRPQNWKLNAFMTQSWRTTILILKQCLDCNLLHKRTGDQLRTVLALMQIGMQLLHSIHITLLQYIG